MTLSQARPSNDTDLDSTAGAGKESFPLFGQLPPFKNFKHCWASPFLFYFFFNLFPCLGKPIWREGSCSMHYNVRTQVQSNLQYRHILNHKILEKILYKTFPTLRRLITIFLIKSHLSNGLHRECNLYDCWAVEPRQGTLQK